MQVGENFEPKLKIPPSICLNLTGTFLLIGFAFPER